MTDLIKFAEPIAEVLLKNSMTYENYNKDIAIEILQKAPAAAPFAIRVLNLYEPEVKAALKTKFLRDEYRRKHKDPSNNHQT